MAQRGGDARGGLRCAADEGRGGPVRTGKAMPCFLAVIVKWPRPCRKRAWYTLRRRAHEDRKQQRGAGVRWAGARHRAGKAGEPTFESAKWTMSNHICCCSQDQTRCERATWRVDRGQGDKLSAHGEFAGEAPQLTMYRRNGRAAPTTLTAATGAAPARGRRRLSTCPARAQSGSSLKRRTAGGHAGASGSRVSVISTPWLLQSEKRTGR